MADSATLHRIVGRDDELARLRSDLQLAAAGATTAVIISGEAGIGKTVLCEAATAELSDQGVIRLTVNALPLQALRTGLAPLRTALRRSSAPEDLTRACLARIDAGDPIRAVDDWVEDVVSQAPLVMLIDDLQWADPSLRDMVLYVLTGPRDRRLAVLIAVRDTNLPDGHPVHSWLADVLTAGSVRRETARRVRRARIDRAAARHGARPRMVGGCHACDRRASSGRVAGACG